MSRRAVEDALRDWREAERALEEAQASDSAGATVADAEQRVAEARGRYQRAVADAEERLRPDQ
jgi:hypothetical protein